MQEVVAFDAAALIDLLSKKSSRENKARVKYLVDNVRKRKGRILIPSPSLTEFSVRATQDEIDFLLTPAFQIAPFDKRAALDCGDLIRKFLSTQKTKKTEYLNKLKMKFDLQILAIAKANNVTLLVTDDKQLLQTAGRNGLLAQPVLDLPLPDEARQYPLSLNS
jgi:predicted nucleic acid-binding protein